MIWLRRVLREYSKPLVSGFFPALNHLHQFAIGQSFRGILNIVPPAAVAQEHIAFVQGEPLYLPDPHPSLPAGTLINLVEVHTAVTVYL